MAFYPARSGGEGGTLECLLPLNDYLEQLGDDEYLAIYNDPNTNVRIVEKKVLDSTYAYFQPRSSIGFVFDFTKIKSFNKVGFSFDSGRKGTLFWTRANGDVNQQGFMSNSEIFNFSAYPALFGACIITSGNYTVNVLGTS